MNRRSTLLLVLTLLCLIAGAALSGVFFSSLSPSDRTQNDAEFVVTLAPVVEGKLQVVSVNGRPLFVLKPDAQQRRSIEEMDGHVFDKRHGFFSPELGAYVYWGESTKWGCPLSEMTTSDYKAYWPDSVRTWSGGYWDARCEVSYDYAGRTIASPDRAFNGYAAEWPNLRSPRIHVSGLTLTVSFL